MSRYKKHNSHGMTLRPLGAEIAEAIFRANGAGAKRNRRKAASARSQVHAARSGEDLESTSRGRSRRLPAIKASPHAVHIVFPNRPAGERRRRRPNGQLHRRGVRSIPEGWCKRMLCRTIRIPGVAFILEGHGWVTRNCAPCCVDCSRISTQGLAASSIRSPLINP